MISQEKLKLMIDLAKYEKSEGRHNEIVNSYFKIDYLSKGLLGSFFAYSLCYFVFFVLVVLYNFEELVSNPNWRAEWKRDRRRRKNGKKYLTIHQEAKQRKAAFMEEGRRRTRGRKRISKRLGENGPSNHYRIK